MIWRDDCQEPNNDDLARNKCNFTFTIVSKVEGLVCSESKVSQTILLTATDNNEHDEDLTGTLSHDTYCTFTLSHRW